MSRAGKPFIPLLEPQATRPKSAWFGPAVGGQIIRDQFTVQTWLSIGALVQGSLFLLIGRIALLPAFLYLLYRILDTYAMAVGFKRNTYMDGVIPSKFSAQFPDEVGQFSAKPANDDVVVLLIGARSNHPLQMLAPNFKTLGDYFTGMTADLEEHADEFGMLGMTSWLNTSHRATASENMTVMYFRSVEGLHAFAHSDYHRQGWDWWNREVKNMPHLSIWHEVYHAPKGHWENIYMNSHLSGFPSSTFKYFDKEQGREMYSRGIVDASKGLLRTSAGRMSRSQADEHERAKVPDPQY